MYYQEGYSSEVKNKPGRRISLLPGLLLIFFSQVIGQIYRPIAYLPDGLNLANIFPICVYNANHNGFPEIYYKTYKYPSSVFTRIWEYRSYNRFIPVDTITGAFFIGDLDKDDRADLLTFFTIPGNQFPSVSVFESRFPSPYPNTLVWYSDSTYSGSWGGLHVADFDLDDNIDYVFSFALGEVYIYENIGDDQYKLTWDTLCGDVYNFTSGDFDGDGLMEFVSGPVGGSPPVFECIGDDRYQIVYRLPNLSNAHDIFYGDDLDQDGKPEFIVSSHPSIGGWAYHFRVYEAVGNNEYAMSFCSDTIYRPASLKAGRGSYCGDVDCDGQDELIWAIQDNWYIYKAIGNNNFQRIFTAYPGYNGREETRVYVYDLNGNGYPEIIESGGNNSNGPDFWSETIIWEIEAVRLIYPNGGELFHPNDTVEISWQTFDPPGCDSLSLFFSSDSGYNYDTIVTGIPASDTTYQWIVPDTTSDQCMLMIWAYGPGIGWDFADSTFTIEDVGVSGGIQKYAKQELRIYPNPSYGKVNLDLPTDVQQLTLFDATGRKIRELRPSPKLTIDLAFGIYFLQIQTQTQIQTEKLIILK